VLDTPAPTKGSDVSRARVAVSFIFAAHGAVAGTFATRMPWIADHLDTDPAGLGGALLCLALGALVAMPFAGRITHGRDVRTTTRILMVLWCFALVPPALAPNLATFAMTLLVFGATAGLADVAMNAQGVAVEQRAGRSIMSSLHGMWSVGGLVASGFGVLAATVGLAAPVHFAIAAVTLAVISVLASGRLLRVRAATDERGPAFALPPRPVVLIALVAFAAMFAEIASQDWSALYLTNVAQAPPGVAAAAYSGFAATMAIARLVGDRVVDRLGRVRAVRYSGLAATAGAVMVAAARTPLLAIAGFALIGIGVAVVVPLAFTAAGNAGPRPAHQIAGVSTIAYGAGLIAPAAIGGIAQATSLAVSFVVVALLAAMIILGARTLGPGRASS
jgi:MFS family permease